MPLPRTSRRANNSEIVPQLSNRIEDQDRSAYRGIGRIGLTDRALGGDGNGENESARWVDLRRERDDQRTLPVFGLTG